MSEITVLEKGTPIMISEKSPNLKNLYIGLGWDPADTGSDFDLDATVALCNDQKKLIDSNHLCYYGNLEVKLNDVVVAKHSADDLTGGSSAEGDDEFINLKLDKMPSDVAHIYVLVNIYEAKSRNQHFGQVNNSFIRLMDGDTEVEFAKHTLNNEFANKSGVMVAEVYRMGDEWKAKILAEGVDGTINEILKSYGLE